jgi:ribosomal protein S8
LLIEYEEILEILARQGYLPGVMIIAKYGKPGETVVKLDVQRQNRSRTRQIVGETDG